MQNFNSFDALANAQSSPIQSEMSVFNALPLGRFSEADDLISKAYESLKKLEHFFASVKEDTWQNEVGDMERSLSALQENVKKTGKTLSKKALKGEDYS